MKKLKLKLQELSNAEVLTRQQLKKVLGGEGLVGTTVTAQKQCCTCTYNDGSQKDVTCLNTDTITTCCGSGAKQKACSAAPAGGCAS